jgi:hypothetical protein
MRSKRMAEATADLKIDQAPAENEKILECLGPATADGPISIAGVVHSGPFPASQRLPTRTFNRSVRMSTPTIMR